MCVPLGAPMAISGPGGVHIENFCVGVMVDNGCVGSVYTKILTPNVSVHHCTVGFTGKTAAACVS